MVEFMIQILVYDEAMNLYVFECLLICCFDLGIIWGQSKHRKSICFDLIEKLICYDVFWIEAINFPCLVGPLMIPGSKKSKKNKITKKCKFIVSS